MVSRGHAILRERRAKSMLTPTPGDALWRGNRKRSHAAIQDIEDNESLGYHQTGTRATSIHRSEDLTNFNLVPW